MHFIEHIIEPTKLLLAWQSSDENHRTRYIIGELNRIDDDISLTYLHDTKDFLEAKSRGFDCYTAFPDVQQTYHNVLDAFMRRLPPRKRGDFPQYLEGLRLKPDAQLSAFALLGYSGAKLPSDGFSIIHPFNDVNNACELLLEVAGYRHTLKENNVQLQPNDTASFMEEKLNKITQSEAVSIIVNNKLIGYVNKGLIPTFLHWMKNDRIAEAWVERLNGAPGKPTAYLYVKILSSIS